MSVYPWHQSLYAGLLSRIKADRFHHALLVSGPEACGLREMVDAVATALLCETLTDSGACGQCRSCQMRRAGTHPDCLIVEPEEVGKQIKIDQIRRLGEFVARTASAGQRKVVILDPADAMNASSANSLLKSLEEPSAGTHLLLRTRSASRLLPTIRSRCETVNAGVPDSALVLPWLREQLGERADMLHAAASGRPLLAVTMAQQDGLQQLASVALSLEQALARDAYIPLTAAALHSYELTELTSAFVQVLIDFQRGLQSGREADWRLAFNLEVYRRLAARVSSQAVAMAGRQAQKTLRQALSTANPNRILLIESLLIDWRSFVTGKFAA